MLAQFNSSLFISLMEIRSPKGIIGPWFQSFPLWYFQLCMRKMRLNLTINYISFDSVPESPRKIIYKVINLNKMESWFIGRFWPEYLYFKYWRFIFFFNVFMFMDFHWYLCKESTPSLTILQWFIFQKRKCLSTTCTLYRHDWDQNFI